MRLLDSTDDLIATLDLAADYGERELLSIGELLVAHGPVAAVGHRIVHGGSRFRASVALSERVLLELDSLSDLAPLHNPPAIAAVRAVRELAPQLPPIGCFDTAFHASLPPEAATYAVPWEWTERWGTRRYGFHGLSHSYVSRRAAELLGRPLADLRIVSCHLGAGASLAGSRGRSLGSTTMGFTPLEGLVMATRSGSVDPGILIWAQRHRGLSLDAIEHALEQESGVLGISGVSSDMRVVLEAAEQGHERARLAIAVYVHRLRAGIASMAAAMGGLDVLIFTGGVGEASAWIREQAVVPLGFMQLQLDTARNRAATTDGVLSPPGSAPAVLMVRAREDLEIAREVRLVLRNERSGA